MPISYTRLSQYLSLTAITLLTILAIYNKSITVFYIIYLFWWDEFIKTLFDRIRYRFKNKNQIYPPEYILNCKDRLFMLMIYFVFIVVFFGVVLNWRDEDLSLLNLQIFLFHNTLFSFSVMTFFLRELYILLNSEVAMLPHSIASKGIIILHISIIFGIIFWFLASKKYVVFQDYAILLSILPFLILKIIFEVQEIKSKTIETASEF